jgi:flagellar motor switch protein FliN/FliY
MKAILEWLVAQWTHRFGEITLTMGDLQPKMQVQHVDAVPAGLDLLWWEQPFSCAPDAPVWTGAAEATWSEIGKIILTAAGVDPAPVSEIQSTYMEIVRQSMGSLAQDLGARIGTQVSAANGAETAPRPVAHHCFHITAGLPDSTGEFYLVIADSLCDTIAFAQDQSDDAETTDVVHSPIDNGSDPFAGLGSRTFELLLDVELPVSVSFGRAALKLQDAIKLITGSLIELDRGLNDPVELLVNNCVIARGEVVVVEGNYGVRITEIVSQKERLQQTRRYMLQ